MTIQMKAKSELYFPVVFSINMFEKCFWWVFRRRILKYNYVDWKLEFRIGVHRPKYAPEAFLYLDYARHSAYMGIRVCIWVCDHSDESYHDYWAIVSCDIIYFAVHLFLTFETV